MTNVQELTEKIKDQSHFCVDLLREVEGTVIGQKDMVKSILTGILADGHILLEGLPGLAKTTAVSAEKPLDFFRFISCAYSLLSIMQLLGISTA